MRHQSYWPVAVELLGVRCLWHWDDAGRLPELWHSPQLQAQVRLNVYPKIPQQLVCAGLQEPGADAIRTRRFPNLVPSSPAAPGGASLGAVWRAVAIASSVDLFCQHSVDLKRKNTWSDHIVSKSHVRNKEKYNNASETTSLQTCITASTFKSSDSRKEFIEDFVAMCAEADIPLEKMTKLRPFLLKHCKQGGALPENVSKFTSPECLSNNSSVLQKIRGRKYSVVVNETTDARDCSVLNIVIGFMFILMQSVAKEAVQVPHSLMQGHVDQDSYQNGKEDNVCKSRSVNSVNVEDMSLCLAAIQKLVEYIKFNFMEGDTAPLDSLSSYREGLDIEVHAVSLSKDKGDTADFGLSYGNIPIFGDPDGKKKGGPRRRRDRSPIMDVGCVWVTEVKKGSPAAHSGRIKLRDEVLSLNGQLMVGVDVGGASYLAEQCWNGGCIYLIMLRRVKRKAPPPPSNVHTSVTTLVSSDSCEEQQQGRAASEPSDHWVNCTRTRKFGVTSRSSFNQDNRDSTVSELQSCINFSIPTDAQVSHPGDDSSCIISTHTPTDESPDTFPWHIDGSHIWKMHMVKGQEGLGIEITGGRGSKCSSRGIIITHVEEGGAIHRDSRLCAGDELLMINGQSLVGLTHQEAVAILRSTTGLVQLVVASRELDIVDTLNCFPVDEERSVLCPPGPPVVHYDLLGLAGVQNKVVV
ncbi:hypothetical protein L3Q82_006678 [Scortum barcoo]|uniref:Uncharacterized protein n=1 Tax=Scortum barcoo TaxID=214431 RepID=A0ACB8WVT5_9TELE|nr:hypothetical protein L3Q82_006678 [Scortum barcoo]